MLQNGPKTCLLSSTWVHTIQDCCFLFVQTAFICIWVFLSVPVHSVCTLAEHTDLQGKRNYRTLSFVFWSRFLCIRSTSSFLLTNCRLHYCCYTGTHTHTSDCILYRHKMLILYSTMKGLYDYSTNENTLHYGALCIKCGWIWEGNTD